MSNSDASAARAELPDHLSARTAIVVAADLTLFARLAEELADDNRAALYLEGFYHLCAEHLQGSGGQIIKFIGDSVLALYPEESAVTAVDAVARLRAAYIDYRDANGIRMGELRAALHIGEVIVGQYGPLGHHDILGRTVNTTFMLIQSAGITISEQLYRKLPSDRRSPFSKRTPRTVYVMQ